MSERISRGRFGHHTESPKTESTRRVLPSDETASRMALLASGFADQNRVRLLCALQRGPTCVGDLALILSASQSAVSHQLKLLRSLGLVKGSRQGRHIYYELCWSGGTEVLRILSGEEGV